MPHVYSEHLGYNNTPTTIAALFYECVWIRKQKYLIVGCSESGSRGDRDGMHSVFAYSRRRVFTEEAWSAGLGSSPAGAQMLTKPRSSVRVSPCPSTVARFSLLAKHI